MLYILLGYLFISVWVALFEYLTTLRFLKLIKTEPINIYHRLEIIASSLLGGLNWGNFIIIYITIIIYLMCKDIWFYLIKYIK